MMLHTIPQSRLIPPIMTRIIAIRIGAWKSLDLKIHHGAHHATLAIRVTRVQASMATLLCLSDISVLMHGNIFSLKVNAIFGCLWQATILLFVFPEASSQSFSQVMLCINF